MICSMARSVNVEEAHLECGSGATRRGGASLRIKFVLCSARISLRELTNDAAGVACGEYVGWNVSIDHASGADYGTGSDGNTRKNQRAPANPNV